MAGTRVYLRGIDLAKLAQNYLEGKYEKMSFDNFGKTLEQTSESFSKFDQLIAQKDVSDIECCYSALTGKKYICIGQKLAENGNYVRIPPNTNTFYCMNCVREFTGFYWGIPIKKKVFGNQQIYFTIDIFCRPECTLREIRQRKQNKIYNQSEHLFSEMYEARTGEKFSSLKPASDPRLLQIKNGPLTWDQYHRLSISYT
jgi:hypothetical protein